MIYKIFELLYLGAGVRNKIGEEPIILGAKKRKIFDFSKKKRKKPA